MEVVEFVEVSVLQGGEEKVAEVLAPQSERIKRQRGKGGCGRRGQLVGVNPSGLFGESFAWTIRTMTSRSLWPVVILNRHDCSYRRSSLQALVGFDISRPPLGVFTFSEE